MKRLLPIFISLFFAASSYGQFANTVAVKVSNAITSRYTPTINALTSKGWEYSNTIILHGMEKVYNKVSDPAYLAYIKAFIDTYLNADGTFKASVTLVSLDRVHPGISVLFLYEKLKSNPTDSLKYRTAATALRNVLVGGSASYAPYRTPVKKIFWHKQSGYDNIMMLDGIYMAHPFLAKYGRLFNDNAAIDTAVNQALFAYNQLYSSGTHLIKHAWKEPGSSGTVAWDDAAGNSTSVWSRAMGWYTMALVDILKYVPAAHPKRAQLLTALSNLAVGIKTYQDATSHLWYQVVDKTSASLPGNYIETSGSAMFIYTLRTAIDSGWISSATYGATVQSAWTGLQAKIGTYSDGKPQILDFAPAMSVQDVEANYVSATLQPVDCPVATGTQHPHGYAAVLMAAAVMEFSPTLPVSFISFMARQNPAKTTLTWQIGDESDVDHYEIQRSASGTDFNTIGIAAATGLSTYTFDDNSIENKTLYYRINAVYRSGSAHYSATIAVRRNSSKGFGMKISPNPVQDGTVNILLENVSRGAYYIKVINNAGTIIKTGSVLVNDETTIAKSLSLPPNSGSGIYYVQLEGNGLKVTRSIAVK